MPPWADLLPDLLRRISGRVRDPADLVRFHAVCRTWRDALPTSPYPLFPPWLLAPAGVSTTAAPQFRPIFSNAATRPNTTWCPPPGTYHSRWLGTEDGAGAWLLTIDCGGASPRLVDPFTGVAIPLPPFPEKMLGCVKHSSGIVCSDGTIVLYTVYDYVCCKYHCYIAVVVLRPGDGAWVQRKTHLMLYTGFDDSCAAEYHKGSIVLVDRLQVYIVKLRVTTGNGGGIEDGNASLQEIRTSPEAPVWCSFAEQFWGRGPRQLRQSIHAFESRGELLAACVVLATSDDADENGDDSRALAAAMSVCGYTLEESVDDGQESKQRWVWRDGRSLCDRVLFLGSPTSFAVDAARFAGAAVSGGCAYLVLDSREAGWSWRKVPEARRVYRYSFQDGSATELEELPPNTGGTRWDRDKALMWIMSHPSAATSPTHEIRERPDYFKIFVGNVPSWVDGFRLKQFFNNYAYVAHAKVVCDTRTGRSLEYGFVTMATTEEPAELFAAIDGQIFCGYVLRVKKNAGGRPKGPFVMPLLAQHNKA